MPPNRAVAQYLVLSLSSGTVFAGKSVDWFAIIKLPLSTEYLYADASNDQFELSEVAINDDGSALTQTIAGALQAWHAFYNDQPIKSKYILFSCCHTR